MTVFEMEFYALLHYCNKSDRQSASECSLSNHTELGSLDLGIYVLSASFTWIYS